MRWFNEIIIRLNVNTPYFLFAIVRTPAIRVRDVFSMIRAKKPFALARYCDGEYFLMAKKAMVIYPDMDNWAIPSRETKLGKALLETIHNPLDGLYYALPLFYSYESDVVKSRRILFFYRMHVKQKKRYITSTTIFVNANYKVFLTELKNMNKEVVLFANEHANIDGFPWKVKEYYPISTNCVKFFEEHGDDFIKDIRRLAKKYNDTLFVACAGPLGNIISYEGWKENNANTYIDFGSAFDEFLFGRKTRPYHDPNNFYSTIEDGKFNAKPLI